MNTVLFVNATIGFSENLFLVSYRDDVITTTTDHSCVSACVSVITRSREHIALGS